MDPPSETFSALADPTRRAIIARLARGEASVGELAKPFDVSLPAISRHLKVLERAGLIERGREAQWRPCRLEAQAVAGDRPLARTLPPVLAGKLRSSRSLSHHTPGEGRAPAHPQANREICQTRACTPQDQAQQKTELSAMQDKPSRKYVSDCEIIIERTLKAPRYSGFSALPPAQRTSANGGVRMVSPLRPRRWTFAPAATGASRCTGRTAPTIPTS